MKVFWATAAQKDRADSCQPPRAGGRRLPAKVIVVNQSEAVIQKRPVSGGLAGGSVLQVLEQPVTGLQWH